MLTVLVIPGKKGGGSALSSNPEKGRAGRRRERIQTALETIGPGPTRACCTALGNSTEECKILRDYRKKMRANGITRNTIKRPRKDRREFEVKV